MSDYKWVPVEPTAEMVEAYQKASSWTAPLSTWGYKAMLRAAPAVQPAEQPECGCCGQTVTCDDDCDAVVIGGNKPASDVSALVEALDLARNDLSDWIASSPESSHIFTVKVIARIDAALAAHRNQGDTNQ